MKQLALCDSPFGLILHPGAARKPPEVLNVRNFCNFSRITREGAEERGEIGRKEKERNWREGRK
jgi:hypothetical protein